MRLPSRDSGFQVLEMVSLEVLAKQSCLMWQRSSTTSSEAPSLIQERTNSWFLGWVYAWSRISPFPISFSLRNVECCSVTLPGAVGCTEEAGDGCHGDLVLFPASFAAKVHHFFSVFPMETSSIFTITTVPWVCARLFAGMRRWLQGESRVGTATNDLLFPSGKAEWGSDGEGWWCVPHSWEQGHVAVAVQGERSGQEVPPARQKGRSAPCSHWG